jgi:predicted phage terminase large subunit-like protein
MMTRDELREAMWRDFLLFCRTFYPILTKRDFLVPTPVGRESHVVTIARELSSITRMQQRDTLINIPPGYFKSSMLSLWVSWCMSMYPDSNFMYVSYSSTIAEKHTEFIRAVMMTSHYQELFGVKIQPDSKAKGAFLTAQRGSVKAFGASGSITGQDAGLPNLNRFSGAVIIDDPHKPDEVHSDTMRDAVIDNYRETISQRPRSPNVPIIFIGQRLHEADLAAYLLSGKDERTFKPVILKSLDDNGNALCPQLHTREMLEVKKDKNPYVFASQFQQNPIPAGGGLFKKSDFLLLDEEPRMIATFITADTAETSKTYNDATAFSFWGIYRVEDLGIETDIYALHWINAREIRVEPRELKDEFLDFYRDCMLYPTPPSFAAIEKKSTGVTLISVLEGLRGIAIRDVKRTKADGSKTTRFLEMQQYVSQKLVTFTRGARHAQMCVEHMSKITANDSHAHDDLCDNAYDAVRIALIDRSFMPAITKKNSADDVVAQLARNVRQTIQAGLEAGNYDAFS